MAFASARDLSPCKCGEKKIDSVVKYVKFCSISRDKRRNDSGEVVLNYNVKQSEADKSSLKFVRDRCWIIQR